jgi:ribosomal protein S18 acetylase RimI-like enzyme
VSQIRPLEVAQVRQASGIVSRAFYTLPGYVAALDTLSPERRLAVVERIKRGICNAYARYHEASALWVGDRMAGVSLVASPGQYPPHLRSQLWAHSSVFAVNLRGLRRILAIARAFEKHHIQEPHYYLFILAVDPELHGRGHGKALARALNDRADARRVPCYLETDEPRNLRLYRSLGYEVIAEYTIPEVDGLPVWSMRREPR